jgi:hypothetical protein
MNLKKLSLSIETQNISGDLSQIILGYIQDISRIYDNDDINNDNLYYIQSNNTPKKHRKLSITIQQDKGRVHNCTVTGHTAAPRLSD